MQYIKDLLSSDDNSPSIKRFGALICLATMIISFFIAQAFGKVPPTFMWDSFSLVVLPAFAGTIIEKFVPSKPQTATPITGTTINP